MEPPSENVGTTAIILVPDDKGRQTVFGIPAVRRLTLLARQVGLTEIHVIGKVKTLQPILSDLIPPERFYPAEDLPSVGRVVEGFALPERQRVLILKSNQVIDPVSMRRLAELDVSPVLPYYVEAKGNHGAEGIYLSPPSFLVSLLSHLWSPAANPSPSSQAQPIPGVDGLPYVLDGEGDQAQIAERKLMRAQATQTEEADGFLARHLNRRVSRFISRGIVRTPVTPNQITLAGASIGIAGAFLLSWAGYWPKLIGSLLFLFCIIIDGVDGEIARLKLQATALGHYLDILTDNLVHVAIFAGITLGLYRDSANPDYFWILCFLMGGFGLCAIAVYQCILRRSPAELRQSPHTIRIMALLSNRDFAYIVVVLALVQRLNWFLLGAAIGTYLFTGTLWVVSFYERRFVAR